MDMPRMDVSPAPDVPALPAASDAQVTLDFQSQTVGINVAAISAVMSVVFLLLACVARLHYRKRLKSRRGSLVMPTMRLAGPRDASQLTLPETSATPTAALEENASPTVAFEGAASPTVALEGGKSVAAKIRSRRLTRNRSSHTRSSAADSPPPIPIPLPPTAFTQLDAVKASGKRSFISSSTIERPLLSKSVGLVSNQLDVEDEQERDPSPSSLILSIESRPLADDRSAEEEAADHESRMCVAARLGRIRSQAGMRLRDSASRTCEYRWNYALQRAWLQRAAVYGVEGTGSARRTLSPLVVGAAAVASPLSPASSAVNVSMDGAATMPQIPSPGSPPRSARCGSEEMRALDVTRDWLAHQMSMLSGADEMPSSDEEEDLASPASRV